MTKFYYYHVIVNGYVRKILQRKKQLTASQQDNLMAKYWNRYSKEWKLTNYHGRIDITLNICTISR